MSNQIINSSTTASVNSRKSSTIIITTPYNVVTEERLNGGGSKGSKIPALKTQIKAQIKTIQNEEILETVNALLKGLAVNQLIHQTTQPKRENLTVEDLINEQNYKGFDRVGFDKLVAELAVQESIEELLALSNQ